MLTGMLLNFFFHGKNSLQLIEKQGRPVPQNPDETAAQMRL